MPSPDTYGWDTVFAISIARVNPALATIPESSPYSMTQPVTGGTATVAWTLKNWRITDTPGGDRLVVAMDFGATSQLTSTSSALPASTSLDGWTCTVTFQAFFDDTDPVTQQLRAKTSSGQKWADVLVSGGTFTTQAVVAQLLDTWFTTSLDAVSLFDQEFATFDLGADVGNTIPWLRPRKLGFAGATMADRVTKALGILAVTQGTETDPLTATLALSPYAILPNAAAGFVVSREVVMRNMILKACQSAFSMDGVGLASNFQLSGPGLSQLTNTAELQFMQQSDGAERAARLAPGKLQVSLEGELLNFQVAPMNVDTAHDGFTLDATVTEQLQMRLADKPGDPGAKVFLLSDVAGQAPEVAVVMSHGVAVAAAVATVVATALAAGLAVATFKGQLAARLSTTSAKIWARVIAGGLGLIAVAITMSPVWIELALQGEQHDLPDFAPVLTVGLSGLTWPGTTATNFHAVEGQFANGMLITVDPQFT